MLKRDRGLSRMLRQNRAGLHKEVGLLVLLLLAGCTVAETDPSRYRCNWIDEGKSWNCIKDNIEFNCEYKERR